MIYHSNDLSHFSFLVTGGAGFIGSNIVAYLLNNGAKRVRVFDDFSTGLQSNIDPFKNNPSFEFMEGDIRSLDACHNAVKEMDYVSHQAALGSVPRSVNNPIITNDVNISGFLNMLVASRDAKVKRFVYAASSSTYGDHPALPKTEDAIGKPLSPYAITKYVNELYGSVFSAIYDFHTIGLRYFNVFGPGQNSNDAYAAVVPLFVDSALKNQAPFINGDGETSRDFTFVENVVQANIKAMMKADISKHEVINIACNEQTSLNQLWRYVCEVLDVTITPKYRKERKGDIKHSMADINKAKKIINYNPEILVLDGLKKTINWYKNTL